MRNVKKFNDIEKGLDFSIVTPIFNEEENIPELYRRLVKIMESLSSFEVTMVDDGSKDSSWSLIKELNEKDSRVKGCSFSRSFGHHIAITAGLDYTKGKAIILMDGDLKDPPEEIPKLYDKYKERYDIVKRVSLKRYANFIQNFIPLSSFTNYLLKSPQLALTQGLGYLYDCADPL